MTVASSHAVEYRVRDAIMTARREVREVKIHVHASDGDEMAESARQEQGRAKIIRSDFGQDGCKVE